MGVYLQLDPLPSIFILKQVKKHMHWANIGHQEKKLGFGLVVLIFENFKRQGGDFFLDLSIDTHIFRVLGPF